MTNAEWLIQNKIPFKNINVHIEYIKGIVSIYVKDYEKIVYNLDDTSQEENLVNTFPTFKFFESWLDNEADEMLFVKKILNKKEKNWIVNLIKPFYQKIEHLMDIEVMRHVKDDKIVIETSADQVRMELAKWAISTNDTAEAAAKEKAKKDQEAKAKAKAAKKAAKNK